ncbi:MAG: 30S ribosomal protein S6 [Candidatus Paceibacterota bacterium]|jgi:ribosomal protein S6
MAKQDIQENEIEGADEMLDEGGSEPRVYELGFHLDPELPTEEVKKEYQALRALIAGKGTVIAEGEPEKIPLAYTISRQETSGRRDFDSAYFAWIVYETPAENHDELITTAGATKRIIRFIDLLTTKDAARHSVEIREISQKMIERTKEPVEVEKESTETEIDTELDAALERTAV